MRKDSAPAANHPFPSGLVLVEDGLRLDAQSILVRRHEGRLALEEDGERCLALMSILDGKPVSAGVLDAVAAADAHLRRGDLALANLRLVFARLPRITGAADVDRVRSAAHLLDRGVAPRRLMDALGLGTSELDLAAKYDRNQPRVPAGNGRASGEWSSGDRALVTPVGAARGFLAGASPEALAALTRFAARFSAPRAVLGALIIPTPNSGGVTEGALPDASDIAFRKDGPAGLLTLKTTSADHDVVVVARNEGGLYVEVRSGRQIGRDLGGQMYLSLDAVQDVLEDARAARDDEGPKPKPSVIEDEPRLCPAPERDTPHGSSLSSKTYEEDVHARVNPLAPIPPEFAVRFANPATGASYYFDDCFRYAGDLVDGDMQAGDLVDAKGPGPEFLLLTHESTRNGVSQKFLVQAQAQLKAVEGTGRRVKWYFAEPFAASFAREIFKQRALDISVSYMPSRRKS